MIDITYGETGSDCTCKYFVKTNSLMTVGEFIAEWLAEHPHEWGEFCIPSKELRCDYGYGKLKSEPFSDEILATKFTKVSGGGGWSRSDFSFSI